MNFHIYLFFPQKNAWINAKMGWNALIMNECMQNSQGPEVVD